MLNAGQGGNFTAITLAASWSRKASAHPFVWLLTLIFMETIQHSEAAGLILYQEYFTFTKGLKRFCSKWANEATSLLPTFTVALLTPSSSTHLKQKVEILVETIYNFKLNTFWNSKTKKPNIILFYTVPPRYESTICSVYTCCIGYLLWGS